MNIQLDVPVQSQTAKKKKKNWSLKLIHKGLRERKVHYFKASENRKLLTPLGLKSEKERSSL